MYQKKPSDWFAVLATALSLFGCYGTLATIALLGALGVTIGLNEVVWAGAIVLFAGLAFIALLIRWRIHRCPAPLLLAGIGVLLTATTILVSYERIIELLGFAFLCAGTLFDWRIGHMETRVPRDPIISGNDPSAEPPNDRSVCCYAARHLEGCGGLFSASARSNNLTLREWARSCLAAEQRDA